MVDSKPGAATILVLHGPNLNLLGEREPEVYGRTSLAELDEQLRVLGSKLGLAVRCVQTNSEAQIIDELHQARSACAGVVLNPGGYTHTSVAIADALRAIEIPAIEVHLSNLYAREPMRHASVTGTACRGVVMGLGPQSYHLALRALASMVGSTA